MARKSSMMQERSDRKFLKKKQFEPIMYPNKQKALCKQAIDLSVLCGIEFMIIIFSITGEPFIFDKPDAESINRFLQAKQATECSSSCRTTIEKFCDHKRPVKIDQKRKMIIDDRGKGINENIIPAELFPTYSAVEYHLGKKGLAQEFEFELNAFVGNGVGGLVFVFVVDGCTLNEELRVVKN
ncbi:hypothetical protein CQW23_09631 [Capsicum baccatum]|uniref:MADS-box domain-containing protein n=1 Tax=Capsicum baccatum TaxID=33114 RepID=A0A2G2WXB5_CAPBA|nr:hypothetical protein CQW23_09631 [Capsicum baccatum]